MREFPFSRFAESNPEALALVDPQERHWTRGALAALTNGISRALRGAGLQTGDILAIVAPNCMEYMAWYLAATQVGLYVVPVNWHLTPGEIAYILVDSGAKALVAHSRLAQAVLSALASMAVPPPVLVSIGAIRGFVPADEFISGHSGEPVRSVELGRVLSYTSATTGKPKGVVLPLKDAARALDMAIERRVSTGLPLETQAHLCTSTLYHGAPLEAASIALHMGHLLVMTDGAPPETILRLIGKYQVTHAFVVPALFTRLLMLSDEVRSQARVSSLRRVVHSGAPCPTEIKRRMIEWLGPIIWEIYGATEGSGTQIDSEEWLRYPGTVGRPIPGTRLKIIGDDGRELLPGSVGTIYMTRFAGDDFEYKGDEEKTRSCHLGEFFTVGDVGYLNEEGYLFISDRKADMIITGGINVYCAEVENELLGLSSVADCAVFGVPDRLLGEAVVAMVQPRSGVVADLALKRQIQASLATRLSREKLPRFISFESAIPRSATGKLQKRRLREWYLERQRGAKRQERDRAAQ